MQQGSWRDATIEAGSLALDSLKTERTRSVLAVAGLVIGIVTVVLVASVLANVRDQIALLFRDLGTENVFAFHLTGDPYVTASEQEARRRALKLEFVDDIRRLSDTARDVAAQVIVPTATEGQVLVARAGLNESDTVLVEGASPTLFAVVGAEFARGRPAISLFIGAVGVANVMFISVSERTREIGLRLAVGARRNEVKLQFLIEAVVLSGVGGIAGVLAPLASDSRSPLSYRASQRLLRSGPSSPVSWPQWAWASWRGTGLRNGLRVSTRSRHSGTSDAR